jgi:hypothetical protein
MDHGSFLVQFCTWSTLMMMAGAETREAIDVVNFSCADA